MADGRPKTKIDFDSTTPPKMEFPFASLPWANLLFHGGDVTCFDVMKLLAG